VIFVLPASLKIIDGLQVQFPSGLGESGSQTGSLRLKM